MTTYTDLAKIPLLKYGLIHADPPWRYLSWSEKGEERSASQHYDVMTWDDILNLPVHTLAGRECWLVLWIPAPFAHRVHEVLEAWRFRPVTMGFWCKTQKHNPARPRIGTGHVLREAGEPFFIGRIGSPPRLDRGIPSVIMEPRREASRKPEGIYSLCNRLAGPEVFKLDFFSRQARHGWDSFGNEVDKFEICEAISDEQ